MTTKKYAYQLGRAHGVDIPTYNYVEGMTEDEFFDACYKAEENSRQYTPFEFTANLLNKSRYSDENWDAFDKGIADVFQEYWDKLQA